MLRPFFLLFVCLALLLPATSSPRRARCSTCARTASGRIKRSTAARREFRCENPCPATGETSGACPGYVIDHRIALECGGRDEPGNMQWQTRADASSKDLVEKNCVR